MSRSLRHLFCLLGLSAGIACAAGAGDDAAILAVLSDARRVTATAEGFQLTAPGGQRQRAVRTMDGGYSVFSTNGSYRLFRTPSGFGFVGPSNETRRVTMSANGFSVESSNGVVRILRTGSGWVDPDAPDHFRIAPGPDGFETHCGMSAPLDGETANARLRQMTQPQLPGGLPPRGIPAEQPR